MLNEYLNEQFHLSRDIIYLSLQIRCNQSKIFRMLDKPGKKTFCYLSKITYSGTFRKCAKENTLLLKYLLFMLSPNIHKLSSFVHFHWVIHKTVHVDELHTPLFRVIDRKSVV